MENWKPVVGYEGLYEVSDLGRVRSMDRVPPDRRLTGRFLRPQMHSTGCTQVALGKRGGPTKVHIIVARAFIGERPAGYEVDHMDHDRTNNAVKNLRYVTHRANSLNRGKRAIFGDQSLPLGVKLTASGKFGARCVNEWIGSFDTPKEAHLAYLSRRSVEFALEMTEG